MPQVVFVSTPHFQSPRDRLTEFLSTVAMIAAIVAAVMAGYQTGGILGGLVLGFVTFLIFPFLLAFGAILLLALSPWLALPGTWLANRLGWSSSGPDAGRRLWLQRLSIVVLLIPLIVVLERNAVAIMGFIAGVAAFGFLLIGLLLLVPILLVTGLILYSLSYRSRTDFPEPTFRWSPPDYPKLPPTQQ